MYLWDQLEEGTLGTLLSLEEQILNSTFEACDTQRTGWGGQDGVGWETQGVKRDWGVAGNWEAIEREGGTKAPSWGACRARWVIVGSFKKEVDKRMEAVQDENINGRG